MAGVRWCGMSAGALKTLAVLSACILWSPASGAAEYRLDVGDVLEISVAGVPDLRQRVSVELDGNISFPSLGTLEVGGLAPSEVRAKIQAILPTKVFRQRGPDGRDNVVVLDPDQITVSVVEYRPIYVNGDVSKPGEQVYRPRMTVRQAIAQAGGYEIMRFRMNNPFLEAADLRGEYESLWTDFAKEQARIWRLKAELGETNITPEFLHSSGVVSKNVMIKILGDGELKSALTVKAHKFSKSAQEKITKAGGKFEVIQ